MDIKEYRKLSRDFKKRIELMKKMSKEEGKKPHPLVEKALELAYEGFETVQFDNYAIEELEMELQKYFGKVELVDAIVNLLNLASVLDDQGSKKAALQIITIVATAADELKKITDLRTKGKL